MEYKGKLYGKAGNTYFPLLNTTEDWDKLEQSNKDANEFIKDIAKLLGMDTDGLGYDELKYSIDDFESAISDISHIDHNELVCSKHNKKIALDVKIGRCVICGEPAIKVK